MTRMAMAKRMMSKLLRLRPSGPQRLGEACLSARRSARSWAVRARNGSCRLRRRGVSGRGRDGFGRPQRFEFALGVHGEVGELVGTRVPFTVDVVDFDFAASSPG